MKAISVYNYIYLGTSVRYLQDVLPGHPVHKEGFVVDNIDTIIDLLKSQGFPVSGRAFGHQFDELQVELRTHDPEGMVDSDLAKRISDAACNFRLTLDAETSGSVAYVVTDKRYAIDTLTGGMWKLFRNSVKDRLPDIAISDIAEAGKCIAFERATAAAFHLMRATEATLKEYYCHKIKRNRVKFMWGPMVTHLRARLGGQSQELLDHLDNIRINFRNPTQHPEKLYDIEEVQDLLGLCIDVVNRMASDMPDRVL